MSKLQQIHTDDAPAAIGPYSQAVRVGEWIYCSGQIAIDPTTQEFHGGDVKLEAERALTNLGAVLEAAGTDFHHVVKTTVFLADMGDFPVVNEIYGRYFDGEVRPARATVQAAMLPKGALVEIDCVAVAKS